MQNQRGTAVTPGFFVTDVTKVCKIAAVRIHLWLVESSFLRW